MTANAPLGRFPDQQSVVLERILPGSPTVVWSYLTDPTHLKTWLAGGTVDLRVGGLFELDFDLIVCPGREDVHGTMQGLITACDPPRLLVYQWGESGTRKRNEPDSLVTFELTPTDAAHTLLTLTHTRILPRDLSPIAGGWHIHLDVLEARLNHREPTHFMDAWHQIEPEYRKLL